MSNPCSNYEHSNFNFLCYLATPPPPAILTVDVNSMANSLTVSWTPPSNVGGYLFTVTGEDCGDCVNTTVNADSVSCSGWPVNDQTCIFEVRTVSQDCGFTSAALTTPFVFSGMFGKVHDTGWL